MGYRQKEKRVQRWLDSITNSIDVNLSKLQKIGKDREAGMLHPWGCKESDTT